MFLDPVIVSLRPFYKFVCSIHFSFSSMSGFMYTSLEWVLLLIVCIQDILLYLAIYMCHSAL